MRHAIRGGLIAAVVMGSTIWTVPASAGGGCHQESLTEGDGDTVAMSEACFDPGVLRVDPGTEVTFVNQDPMTHNVSATGWGFFGEMNKGDTFQATFDDEGVFPFACTYHPGMTGAIVVGDGLGAGSGVTSTSSPTTSSRAGGPARGAPPWPPSTWRPSS
jgi:plastocyanin